MFEVPLGTVYSSVAVVIGLAPPNLIVDVDGEELEYPINCIAVPIVAPSLQDVPL